MQVDPTEDTEWNDILRAKGIIPELPNAEEPTEHDEALIKLVDDAIKSRYGKEEDNKKELEDCDLDELDELEDEEDERILEEYRRRRMQEMQLQASKEKYGEVTEISKPDFVKEVSEASNETPVIVFLYKSGIPESRLVEDRLNTLARKFKATKFVRIVASNCIENYPDRNVPTLLLYRDGQPIGQLVGSANLGGKAVTVQDLEWILKRYEMVESDMTEDPSKNEARGGKTHMTFGVEDDE